MDQKNLLTQALGFIRDQRRHRWWLRIVTGMAAAVVFVTTYLLILPAITMEHSILEITATPSEIALGRTIYTEVFAEAEDDREETVFVLIADGDNAGLDENRIDFENDAAFIKDETGQKIKLFREYEGDGTVQYWFTLERGQSVRFGLPWINGVDRYRDDWIREEVLEVPDPVQTPSELYAPESGRTPENGPSAETSPGVDPETSSDPVATGSDLAAVPVKENGIRREIRVSAENAGDEKFFLSWHQVPSVARSYGTATPSDMDEEELELDEPVELILDQPGDVEEEGFLVITFGSGGTLKEAKRRAEDTVELSWLEELPFEIPENATSWATVEKEDFLSEDFGVREMALFEEEAAGLAENGSGHNFADNITSVTVSKLENGQWVPGTEFTDGDSVRVEINYTILANTVGAANQTIHYQLPDGIRLSREESGTVYDGQIPVGAYVIGTDGMITITFNDIFADDKPFNGMIRFEGTRSAGSGGGEQEIEFGGSGGTITVKPSASPTDIRVKKEGSYNKEDGKLHYTVTVSTTKGTEDTVTISDSFGTGNTSAAYDKDSFQIVKVKADGTQETVSGYTPEFGTAWTGGPETFTIKDLPKLEAGEKYVVTYTATPGESGDSSGSSSVYNNATGTSGGDSNNSGVTVTISQQMIQKWGSYNSGTGKIQWTIKLNQDKQDIGGYVLKDTMTIGGETVSIPAGTVITMTGSNGDSQTITLPYTFPAGSSDSYTITYETDAPQGEPGESWTVSNKAELDKDDDYYEAGGDVSGQTQGYNVGKSFDGIDQNVSTDEVGTYKWVSRITVPKAGVELDKLTYTDTLKGVVSEDGKEVADSHYITAALLDKMTVTVNGTALVRGTDYEIRDAQGNVITDFTSQTHLTGFQVKFLEAAKEKVTGQTIELRYQTQVDYTKLTGDGSYTIANKGSIPGHDSESSTDYTPPKKLEKQASITGEGGSSYTGDSISIDYEESGGVIHYRILIHTDASTQGDITLTDLLPKGATLVEDSVKMAFYENDWYEYDTNGSGYKASEHIKAKIGEQNPDGTTPVTFTIDDGYNGDGQHHTLVVYYDLSIKDDPLWTENPGLGSHLYRNEVTWGSESDETDVTVDREVPDIKKTGEQLPQYDANGDPILGNDEKPLLSNTIRYAVVINAAAKDLVPGKDFITMWDQLDVGSAVGAEFRLGSVKLYHYDPKAENLCGTALDSSLYSYTYDETEYKLTFTLPDGTACVLVYEYVIDRGNAAGELKIKNEAHLTGGTGSGGSNEVILEDTSSSATVTKKELTIYKVDATNYGKLLPGAVFQLEVYQNGQWDTLLDDLTSDENGQFVLSRVEDEHFENFNFEDNTLYRLTEITPPAGYSIDTEPYYFVWVKDNMTAELAKQEMESNGALGDVDSGKVKFLTTSGAIYVQNQPTELTVKKLWQDDSGMTIPPGADHVDVTLYQQAVDSNAKTVTVISRGNPDASWQDTPVTESVNVANGSDLTIQIDNVWVPRLEIQVGDRTADIVDVVGGSCSYTVKAITENIIVCIQPEETTVGNLFKDISFSDYTEPYHVPIGDPVKYETVRLNEENSWSYTWESLPKHNKSGQTVYYYVEEIAIPGFGVIYSPNNSDGIQTGELVIINRANGFFLPETGGPGVFLFTMGGFALMALAGLMYMILRRKGGEVP